MVTEAEWDIAQTGSHRLRMLSGLFGLVAIGALSLPAMALGAAAASGTARYLVSAGLDVALLMPIVAILVWTNQKKQRQADATVRTLAQDLSESVRTAEREAAERNTQVRRQRFESRLANALDMSEGEPEVIDVIERSFTSVLPDAPVELLLADNSHAHLLRMASVTPTGEVPGCGVDSPDHCPAARRAQVQRFSDSEELDACPKLRNRPQGNISALCVPVSIMGRTVGVIHATGQPKTVVEQDRVDDLETLAKLAGARIGLLRVMAETQLQAATDPLTGLYNRRSFEDHVVKVRTGLRPFAIAMSDLDHFKVLNDTYGHATGDRALRLFSQVLRESLRSEDLICRYGGEEFAIAFPACAIADAAKALDAVRAHLDAALTVAGLPRYTVSFGVTGADEKEPLPAVLARADVALFEAKLQGRDRVVIHDSTGIALHPLPAPVDPDQGATPPIAAEIRRQLR
jgi:diguanylate cyclase (GGDEF)-like protein